MRKSEPATFRCLVVFKVLMVERCCELKSFFPVFNIHPYYLDDEQEGASQCNKQRHELQKFKIDIR